MHVNVVEAENNLNMQVLAEDSFLSYQTVYVQPDDG
jgi:hypothetical protein